MSKKLNEFMEDFPIPHLAPVRFVKKCLHATAENAIVEIGFETLPTFGMLIEAAVQSASGMLNNDINGRIGFLVTLKDVKLLKQPTALAYVVEVTLESCFGDIRSLYFNLKQNEETILSGSYVVGLQ
jgi:hypothetical protein